MMRYLFLLSVLLSTTLISCKKDEGSRCVTCTSEFTEPFDLCRESDGNAWVNGQNTHTPYDVYLSDLEASGTTCHD